MCSISAVYKTLIQPIFIKPKELNVFREHLGVGRSDDWVLYSRSSWGTCRYHVTGVFPGHDNIAL